MDDTKNEVECKLLALSGSEISILGHQLYIIHPLVRGSGNGKTVHAMSRDSWGISALPLFSGAIPGEMRTNVCSPQVGNK